MPSGMWFREKGPIWTIFDHYFSSPDLEKRLRHKLEVLCGLQTTLHFTDYERDPGSSGLDIRDLKRHIDRDWFGLAKDGSAAGRDDQPTGRWQDWRGNAEGIVRDALIRAIEVSLGLPHRPWTDACEDPLPYYGVRSGGPVPRNWPMEFWSCGPVPWLQAAISWHSDADQGRVEVTWLLHAAHQRFANDLRRATRDFAVNPPNPAPDGPRSGGWIVGQERTRPKLGPGGRILYVSKGDTVVVQPTLKAGGVDPGGD